MFVLLIVMNMDFFQFDDDIFNTSTNAEVQNIKEESPVTFEPRIARWFTSQDVLKTKDNLGMTAKFKGDLAYAQMKYEDAITHFKVFQENIKDKNNLLWRSSEEDIGRCYIKMNDFGSACHCAHNLVSTASNIDQYTCSLFFMIDIFDVFGLQNNEKMMYLKKFILIHPSHSAAWLKLGQCIQELSKQEGHPNNTPGSRDLVLTCFSICYLLEKRKISRTFVHNVSAKLMQMVLGNIKDLLKDEDSIASCLEKVRSKYSVLMDGDKPSVVSIEHWSNNYLEILKDDLLAGIAFDKKWLQ